MDIIAMKPIKEFVEENPKAESNFKAWVDVVESHTWSNFSEIKATFNSADKVGNCVVFDVGGNNYRVIAKIRYVRIGETGRPTRGVVYIKAVLAHKEYSRQKWREQCGCL